MIALMALALILLIVMIPKSAIYLHERLLTTVERAPLSFFTSTDSGQIVNRFSQDLNVLDMELPIAFVQLAFNVTSAILQAIFIVRDYLIFVTVPLPPKKFLIKQLLIPPCRTVYLHLLFRRRSTGCISSDVLGAEILPAYLTPNQTHGSRGQSTTLQQFP